MPNTNYNFNDNEHVENLHRSISYLLSKLPTDKQLYWLDKMDTLLDATYADSIEATLAMIENKLRVEVRNA